MTDEVANSSDVVATATNPASAAASTVAAAADSARSPEVATSPLPIAEKPLANPSREGLPKYTRNLLNVRVPVSVTLATKKQSVKQILELASGSLIQFDKPCEEMLDLCVGEHCIARGVAVKVGEKFGLRVNQLIPPGERFQAVQLPEEQTVGNAANAPRGKTEIEIG
jgi:flagellar motor switch/type III secretory pathway protein FliN